MIFGDARDDWECEASRVYRHIDTLPRVTGVRTETPQSRKYGRTFLAAIGGIVGVLGAGAVAYGVWG